MWLLEPKIEKIMASAEKDGAFTAEQIAAFNGSESSGNGSDILSIAGDTAEITITGVLTNSVNFMAMLLGGGNTTYPDIINAIATAEQNEDVDNIILSIDSPGGHTDGLFEATDAISRAKKPTKAIIVNKATSAAYAIAAQADTIEASNAASMVGSIGVLVEVQVFEDLVAITSSKAPKKHPDVTTEEGRAVIQELLNAMHTLFVDVIARGRGTTVSAVNADFGQGATLLAGEALKSGMIDSIANQAISSTKPPINMGAPPSAIDDGATPKTESQTIDTKTNTKEDIKMDLKTLQTDHPELFAQVTALGAVAEKDRVNAHLKMGNASGDMDTALKAIEAGDALTQTHQATYMAASMNRSDVQAREGDNPDDVVLADPKAVDDAVAVKAADEAMAQAGFGDGPVSAPTGGDV